MKGKRLLSLATKRAQKKRALEREKAEEKQKSRRPKLASDRALDSRSDEDK